MHTFNRRSFIAKVSSAAFAASISGAALGHSFAGREAPRILLYSGWNTKNIGDQGHTPGTLRYLETYFPEAQVDVLLRHTNEDINEMLRRRFPKIRLVTGTIDEQGVIHTAQLQQAFAQADLVIHNSGMHYNSFWNPSPILATCVNSNKPLCLYGQSFDGFDDTNREKMTRLLSAARAIYCRDNESYYYLRSLGVTPGHLAFGPDGCFGIDLINDDKAATYRGQHGLVKGKFIVVIIRTNTPSGPKPEVDPFWEKGDKTQNPWQPSEEDVKQTELWASKLREIVVHWVKATGLKVLLAPEVEKEIAYAKELLYDRLPSDIQSKTVHKAEWWNMDEASSIFRDARAVVAMEPHSCIMALAHRTPILHLFSRRHGVKAWMFRDIGLPEWLHDIDEDPAANPIGALMEIHDQYDFALTKTDRAMNFVERRSGEIVHQIRELVMSMNRENE